MLRDQTAVLGPVSPTWSTPGEAVRVILHRPHLRRTVAVALFVGAILFTINQLDLVLRGEAGLAVWIKGAVTLLVPFSVSNYGILTATRRPRATGVVDRRETAAAGRAVCSSSSG